MGNKPLTIWQLAVANIKRKPLRTAGLIIIVALVAFVLFAGGILSVSLKNGLESMKERLGADLLVVPVGYDEGVEGIIVKGEPAYFYFDKSVETELEKVEGVKSVSSQFYLTSLNQDCCSVPVQFIGFDPETDFSIQPWISEVYSKDIKDGELIIGSDITADENNRLKFFGEEYTVAAKLEETGTGLDQAVYANMNTLVHLFGAAKEKGLTFTDTIDPESSVSSVLVRLEDGYDLDEVTHNIRASSDGLQVIKTKSMVTGIADDLDGLVSVIYVFAALFLVVVLIMLVIVFSVTANERKKEFATLRALGASGKKLARLVITEALLICGIGGSAGTIVSAAIVLSFSTYIGDRLGLPYLQPGIAGIFGIALLALAVSLGLGPLGSAYTAGRLNRREVYLTMREGE